MPLIPPRLIEAIKRDIPCVAVLEARGKVFVKHGDQVACLCPFHDDRNPSFLVREETNEWVCHACRFGGDVIELAKRLDGSHFRRAAEDLVKAFRDRLRGVDAELAEFSQRERLPWRPGKVKATLARLGQVAVACPVGEDSVDPALSQEVVAYYHRRLLAPPEASPVQTVTAEDPAGAMLGGVGAGAGAGAGAAVNAARQYLRDRGLDDADLIGRFSLGYADRTLGIVLPDKTNQRGKDLRTRLETRGWFRAATGHEHLCGSVVVPIIGAGLSAADVPGAVVGAYGRKTTRGLKSNIPMHTYLPGPHVGVWNAGPELVNTDGAVVLTEALFDAMTFWCAGLHHVTASYGVNGFTDDHLAALHRFQARDIFLAYDADAAGDSAAAALADRLILEGFNVYRVTFPPGTDANEHANAARQRAAKVRASEAQQAAAVREAMALVLRAAAWIGGAPRSAVPALPPRPSAAPGAASGAAAPDSTDDSASAGAAAADASFAAASAAGAADAAMPPAPPVVVPPVVRDSVRSLPMPTAVPSLPLPAGLTLVQDGAELVVQVGGTRTYRVRGLAANKKDGALRVMVRLIVVDPHAEPGTPPRSHVDSLDLYQARLRQAFAAAAVTTTGLDAGLTLDDLGAVLLALEAWQADAARRAAQAQQPSHADRAAAITGSARMAALSVLHAPNVLERIAEDLDAMGLVGEPTNKRAAVLAAVSRLLPEPLAVLVQSSSAAGKTTLMDAILRLLPSEAYHRTTTISGRSLYYLGSQKLRNTVLAIAEEEGAQKAAYALKLLQSDGYLSALITDRDTASGRHETNHYRVEGPIMLFLTTTAIHLDPELVNRCLVLTVDESPAQTAKILETQRIRATAAGFAAARERDRLAALHQDVQRLLRPYHVVIPQAPWLRFATYAARLRRDQPKLLALIRASALLHQHQRVKGEQAGADGASIPFIEATDQDVSIGIELAGVLLTRGIDDLPAQTRRLWDHLCRASNPDHPSKTAHTRRGLAQAMGWSYDQVRVHVDRLVELEYVTVQQKPGEIAQYRIVGGIGATAPASPALPWRTGDAAAAAAGIAAANRRADTALVVVEGIDPEPVASSAPAPETPSLTVEPPPTLGGSGGGLGTETPQGSQPMEHGESTPISGGLGGLDDRLYIGRSCSTIVDSSSIEADPDPGADMAGDAGHAAAG